MNRYLYRVLLLVMLSVALFHPLRSVAQNTIHVPLDAPTIQSAIDRAQAGDTVLVAPGTYPENISFKGKAITVTSGAQAFSGAASTIIKATGSGPVVSFDTGETQNAVLNGFTVTGGHADATDCTYGGGILVDGASPVISNNVIVGNIDYGIYVENQSSPSITGNAIRNSHFITIDLNSCKTVSGISGGGTGIYLTDAVNPEIVANLIEGNTNPTTTDGNGSEGAGIFVRATQNILIQNNTIRNNIASANAAIGGTGGYMVFGRIDIIQNLIYGNSDAGSQLLVTGPEPGLGLSSPALTEVGNTVYGGGEELYFAFKSAVIENNIFANPSPGPGPGSIAIFGALLCVDPEASNSPLTIQNNDLYIVGTPSMYVCPAGPANITAAPQFVDLANGDFHEQGTSPTIGAGNIDAPELPQADLDDKARTVCGKVDMGVYELRPHPATVVASSLNPAPGGTAITFSATVAGNCNVPTGAISLYDGTTLMGSINLDGSGVGRLTTAALLVGQHSITAQYGGDFNFEKSTSPPLTQTITGDPTTTTLSVSPNPGVAFASLLLSSSTISPYGTPTGSVTYTAGGKILAKAPLNAGKSTATITSLGAGSYDIVASYTADSRFEPSQSAPFHEVIQQVASQTSLSVQPNPAFITQAVALKAVVRGAQVTAVPTGTVVFLDGSASLGAATLDASGMAQLATSTLALGAHTITARYAGSSDFEPSSATSSETVTLIGTNLSLAASPNPANTGQPVTLTAKAISSLPGMTPFGTVTFLDGDSPLASVSLDGTGSASYTTSSLVVGSHSITAMLPPGSYLTGSTSPTINEVVQGYDFSMQVASPNLSIPSGDYTRVTATLTPIGGFTGSVAFSCNGLPDHAQCVFDHDATVSLNDGPKTVIFSVNTSDVYGYGKLVSRAQPGPAESGRNPIFGVLLPFLGILRFARKKRPLKGAWLRHAFSGALLLTMAILLQGCAGKLPGKTVPGAYVVNLSGISTSGASLQHSVALHLDVTK